MVIHRIGCFFFLVGGGLLALFVLSDIAKSPVFTYLLAGAGLVALGVILFLRNPIQPGPPADRFRTMKKITGKKEAKK